MDEGAEGGEKIGDDDMFLPFVFKEGVKEKQNNSEDNGGEVRRRRRRRRDFTRKILL